MFHLTYTFFDINLLIITSSAVTMKEIFLGDGMSTGNWTQDFVLARQVNLLNYIPSPMNKYLKQQLTFIEPLLYDRHKGKYIALYHLIHQLYPFFYRQENDNMPNATQLGAEIWNQAVWL